MSKLRDRVVLKLRDLGYSVLTDEIYPAQGWYRTSRQADCYRWTAYALRNGARVALCSGHTLTECAATSAALSIDEDGEVWIDFKASKRDET